MVDWSREDLAWAAGLFEGEGCIRAATDRQSKARWEGRAYLDISQSEREVLDRFHQIVGTQFGKVYGPYPKPNRKPYFRYMCTRFEQTQQIVILLWPWLSSRRRQQATLALKTSVTARRPQLKSGPKKCESHSADN